MTAGRPPSRTISTSRPSARSSAAVASALRLDVRLVEGVEADARDAGERLEVGAHGRHQAGDAVAEGGDLVGGEHVGHAADPTERRRSSGGPRVHGIRCRAPTVAACSDAARPPTTSSSTTSTRSATGPRTGPRPSARTRRPRASSRWSSPTASRPSRSTRPSATSSWPRPARRWSPATTPACRRATRARCAATCATTSTPGWNLAEFMLPVMLIVLALSFMRTRGASASCSSSRSSPTPCCSWPSVDTFLMYRSLQEEARRQVRRRGRVDQGQRHVRRDARLPDAPLADAAPAGQARRVPLLTGLTPRAAAQAGPSRLIGP